VIFVSCDEGLRKHETLFKEYFGTVIPPTDNKFAALNSAVWSGGSFIYVPKGVHVDVPLQAYFRINTKNMGQFERTLIIVDEGAYVHYVEGCTAPIYSSDSLHSAVVEIIVKRGGRCRYTTIQNWSNNVYNLVTKRAVAHANATMEWIDGNLGCITGDAGVLVNNDVIPIAQLEPGAMAYSLNTEMEWERRRVVAKKYSGRQQVFLLRGENHREIRATANHPFLTLSKSGERIGLGWKRLDQLAVGEWVAVSGSVPDHGRPRVFDAVPAAGRKPVTIPSESTDDLMWLLGLYVGDGYLDGHRVCFAVPPQDRAHERLVALLKSLFNVDYVVHGNAVRVNSTRLRSWLVDLEFVGGARDRRIPRWVYRLPLSQRVAFLEGFIAADGYRRSNHTNLSITSVHRALLEDTKALAIECGWDPRKISKWTRRELKPLGREEKENSHYALYFGEGELDGPIYFTKVSAIEPLGVEDTWDIEIEGTHNFVANGFVVHNSKLTMKYPAIYMMEPGAHGEVLSIAFAGHGQHQDAGAKAVHCAPRTSSKIISKSISKDGGRAGYRGLVKVQKGAVDCKSTVNCDALILDERSRSDTYPYMEIEEDKVTIGHEATVSKIGDEQIFYLMSRGIPEEEAAAMIVAGFIEPVVKELPMEYAVEMNRLIQLQMEGSVG
jgi:Fe-S cluster assembly scaffold protein SufB